MNIRIPVIALLLACSPEPKSKPKTEPPPKVDWSPGHPIEYDLCVEVKQSYSGRMDLHPLMHTDRLGKEVGGVPAGGHTKVIRESQYGFLVHGWDPMDSKKAVLVGWIQKSHATPTPCNHHNFETERRYLYGD